MFKIDKGVPAVPFVLYGGRSKKNEQQASRKWLRIFRNVCCSIQIILYISVLWHKKARIPMKRSFRSYLMLRAWRESLLF